MEHEYDKGFYSTAWLLMDDVLAEIGKDTVEARLASYRDGLGRALDAALEAATAAAPKPAAGSPETGYGRTRGGGRDCITAWCMDVCMHGNRL